MDRSRVNRPLAISGRQGDHDAYATRRRRMSFGPGETEPSEFRGGEATGGASPIAPGTHVTFERRGLRRILGLYSPLVAAREKRPHAPEFLKNPAAFSLFPPSP